VWIIGGGKTAMDTAHALITTYPGREVNLVAGRGTFFSSRDDLLPSGARRWWAGTPPSAVATQLSHRYDGTNESEVQDWYRATHGTFLTPQADNFVLGVLSEAENRTISAGLNDLVMDYFEDVVDRNGTTELVFRSGSTKRAAGSSTARDTSSFPTNTRTSPTFRPVAQSFPSMCGRPCCTCRRSWDISWATCCSSASSGISRSTR
jgi:hypothetical protein